MYLVDCELDYSLLRYSPGMTQLVKAYSQKNAAGRVMTPRIWLLIYALTRVLKTCSFNSGFCWVHTMYLLLSRQECSVIPALWEVIRVPRVSPTGLGSWIQESPPRGRFLSGSFWVWQAIFPAEILLFGTARKKKSMQIFSICWIKLKAPMSKLHLMQGIL